MRFNLVLLSLFFILTTGVSSAETLRGRVIKLDRTATGVVVALETIDSATNVPHHINVSLTSLPVDIQLNSRITLEAQKTSTVNSQGFSYQGVSAQLDSSMNEGKDRTGVRSRMKRSQRSSAAGRGSQRGKN